jgi:uncharacterized protein (TIGR02246 family)
MALAALVLASCATVPAGPGRAEVLAVMHEQVEAWNRGDLPGFCAGYLDDAVFLTPSGVTHGRAQVLERYTKKYAGDRAGMGQLELTPLDVRATDGAVSVAARWRLVWPDKPEASGHTVVVFVHTSNGWKIAHDASMEWRPSFET